MVLRVRDRLRPVRPAAGVLVDVFAELGLADAPRRPARLVTREGELAALDGAERGDRAAAAGVVLAGDWFRLVVGVAAADRATALGGLVRRLIAELPLGVAWRRRRLFDYAPPPGWSGRRRRRLIAEWLAPGYPDERAMLTVFPARPFGETAAGELDRQLHELTLGGFHLASRAPCEHLVADAGLRGVSERLEGTWMDGARATLDVVLLADGAFTYLVRLDHDGTRARAHRAVLETLVRTITPLPPPASGPALDVYGHLVD
jgi:hypothetical protein